MKKDAPQVWFCELCGEVIFSYGVPSRCPACGAHPASMVIPSENTRVLGRGIQLPDSSREGGLAALQQETDTAELYSRVAGAASHPVLRQSFRALARIEARHAAILAILFKRRKPSPRLRPDLSSETDLAMVRLVRQREDSTIALYKEQLASVEGEVARIYRELMAVEEDHNLLLDELDGLVSG